jgi:hypothetical protein
MIEKNERTYHPPAHMRQHAPDFESAEILAPLVYYRLEHRHLHRLVFR